MFLNDALMLIKIIAVPYNITSNIMPAIISAINPNITTNLLIFNKSFNKILRVMAHTMGIIHNKTL
jgi:hypothetical protein